MSDLRFQYQYWSNKNHSRCRRNMFPCVGGTLPALLPFSAPISHSNAAIGPNVNAPQARNTRRYQVTESLNAKGPTGSNSEETPLAPLSAGLWGFCAPFAAAPGSPEFISSTLGPGLTANFFRSFLASNPTDFEPAVLESGQRHLHWDWVGSVSRALPSDQNLSTASTGCSSRTPGRFVKLHFELRPRLDRADGFYNSGSALFSSTSLGITISAPRRIISANSRRRSASPGARSRTTRPSSVRAAAFIGTAHPDTISCGSRLPSGRWAMGARR